MPTSGVAVVRSRWGPSACRANFLRCVTAYVSLDDESSGITAPPAWLQRKSCKLLKKMLLMRPQNVLMMRELPRSTQIRCSCCIAGLKIIQASAAQANKAALEAEKARDELHNQIQQIEEQLQPKRARTDDDAGDAHEKLAEVDNWDLRDHRQQARSGLRDLPRM